MEATTIQDNQLLAVIDKSGVEQSTADLLKQKFVPFLEQAAEWKEKAESLVVTDESQTDLMKEARTARLALAKIRTSADKVREDLKRDSLNYGRAVQGVYNVIEAVIKPIEDHLAIQEKFKEVQEEKRRTALRIEREKIVEQYREYIPYGIDFADITQTDFDKLINGAKLQQKQAEEEQQKAEQERIENERMKELHDNRKGSVLNNWAFFPTEWKNENFGDISEDKWQELVNETLAYKAKYELEQQRIKEENERLKAEAEKREAEIKAERERMEEEQRKANKAAEKLKRETEEKAAAARKELERIESELQAKKDAEARAEQEKQASIEAELSKGDKQKMLDLIEELGNLPFKYQFKSKKHNAIQKAIVELVEKTTTYAKSKL